MTTRKEPQPNRKPSAKPVAKVKLRGVTASVFANEANGGTYFKVSIARTYRDGDSFKTTTAFTRDDLPLVEAVARSAWLEVIRREAEDAQADEQ